MFNKAILVGRMTADPELKTTSSGKSVCTFRVAVDRKPDKDGNRKADFITVVAWRSTAEFVSTFFQKGKAIGIEGMIQTREYTDKEGNKRSAFEVVADNAFFVGDKKTADVEVEASEQTEEVAPGDSSDLPF